MKTISLNGNWKLRGCLQESDTTNMIELDAVVPGCVQLDLSEAGYLPKDLYMGENIRETEKFEGYEWWYERTFIAPDERDNVYIVFEGVDCIAEYFINDILIGTSENMFISHEFEIGEFLKKGENTLTVHLKSATIQAHYEDYSIRQMLFVDHVATNTSIRKAPHSFGWDIMPRAITAGLWRDVRIEARDDIRFSQLFFITDSKNCKVIYELDCKYNFLDNIEILFKGNCGDDSFFEKRIPLDFSKSSVADIEIINPKTWWPFGYGDANVYDVTAQIFKSGMLVHEEKTQFGLRTVVLDRTDSTDGINGQFRFLVNDVEVMCKGSNWVPLDAFHSRDAGRYDKALSLAKDIGCNILRCWGGNVYEDTKFFDFCDRNGIMIWQDFSFACHIYPENDKFLKIVEQEAISVIRKLRNHPSIILWSGDNEVDEMIKYHSSPEYNFITRKLLPKIVAFNDIGRPYLASSPFVSNEIYQTKNTSLSTPEGHLWGPRDYFKSDYYKQNKAHFVSEIGYHGCPSLESLEKFLSPEKIWPYKDNSEWILHSSDQYGRDYRVVLMENQIRQLFGNVPDNIEEYILASQISQAEAKKYFIERMRVDRPKKTGIIWWNLLDGWPQFSDAVVDYYFEKKLAYDYIKRAQAPFTIAAGEISDWNLPIYACNDTLSVQEGIYEVIDCETEDVLITSTFKAEINCTTLIGKIPVFYSEQKMLIIKWDINGEKYFNHYLCGYPPVSLEKYKQWIKKLKIQ